MLIASIVLFCFAAVTLARSRMYDACIVGAGPAGIAAAVSLAQQQLRVAVLDRGRGALDNGTWLTRMPIPDEMRAPDKLKPFMLKSFDGYDNVNHFIGEVVNIARTKPGRHGHFVVEAEGRRVRARRILLAPGYEIMYPNIPGYKDAWMKVLFNDPLSDGSKGNLGAYSSAVLATDASGSVIAAMHLARMALHYTDRVTIYTNHNLKLSDDISRHLLYEVTTELQKKVRVDNRRISKLHAIEVRSRKSSKGYAQSHKIVIFFADGKDSKHSFMFHLPTGKLNLDFVQDLHIRLTDGGLVKVDPSSMETTEKGIYAAGDCVSFKRTIIRSMFTGQLAAESIAISRLFDY
ncbi:hypothetical protein NW754_011925 [Fusarium falciforme]|uniref:FAD/NAD(P)-binding domain-containing protein n=1 Tax=Fusarium falciforme TaxID=195108 RepID=A0A9W8R727_9HYPO|nr:hypothetical protein NW754_011925 [Fusarium falciforme]KAJ4187127.1 hypothetical protein NW755_007221 [Fusarium falciforme]KAJ4250676.1 hypothetical protein NW757_006878 [Fusarium falciforme]